MELRIRRSGRGDADEIRRIAFETGFFGSSMAALLDEPRRFEPSLGCYLHPGAGTAFVAEAEGSVEGYVIASLRDVRACTIAAVLVRFFLDSLTWPTLSPKDRAWVGSRLRAALRAPFSEERRFRTPAGPRLHINMSTRLRGSGMGSMLLDAVVADLRARGAQRVHANSYQSARNATEEFWLKNGFAEFSRVRTSAWAPYVTDDVWLVCYARPL